MARTYLKNNVKSISGSTGSKTFSSWRGVSYIRGKAPSISTPQSVAQSRVKARLSSAASRWTNSLTQSQRDSWHSFSSSQKKKFSPDEYPHGTPIIHEPQGILSGYNAFIRISELRRSIGLSSWLDAPPLGVDAPNQIFNLAASFVTSRLYRFELTWNDPINAPTGSKIRIWARSYDRIHAQIVGYMDLGVERFRISQLRVAGGGWTDLFSGAYSFQADVVSPDGLKSAGSSLAYVNIPDPFSYAPVKAISLRPVTGMYSSTIGFIPASDFTIEAFYRFSGVPYRVFIYGYDLAGIFQDYIQIRSGPGTKLLCYVRDWTTGIYSTVASNFHLTPNTVYNFALEYDNSAQVMELYIDGVLQNQSPAIYNPHPSCNEVASFSVPLVPPRVDFDQLRWSRGVKYRQNYLVPQEKFFIDQDDVLLYRCDEGGGNQLFDAGFFRRDAALSGAFGWVPPLF